MLPIHYAVLKNNLPMVAMLLENIADEQAFRATSHSKALFKADQDKESNHISIAFSAKGSDRESSRRSRRERLDSFRESR